MKHIQRRFFNQFPFVENKSLEIHELKDAIKVGFEKGDKIFLQTDADMQIQAFPIKIAGKRYYFPEPDPILIYFNNAQLVLSTIDKNKRVLLESLDLNQGKMPTTLIHTIYDNLQHMTGFILFLFTSMEAALNRRIRRSDMIDIKRGDKTIKYVGMEIERLSFSEKVKTAIPEITKTQPFHLAHPKLYTKIDNHRKIRDEIMHTKGSAETHTPHERLFESLIKFNYTDGIVAVKDFINYYHPNLILECSCGRDF